MTSPEKIYHDILDSVGKTPMVRLNRVPQEHGLTCEVLVKCEFSSIAGSTKDRIGVHMIRDAEKKGILKPGMSLVEATAGNTGIGLAFAAAQRGYPLYVTMTDKIGPEKEDLMLAMGAQVIRASSDLKFYEKGSVYQLANCLAEQPNFIQLNQFQNSSNAEAHYLTTAEEILYQCDNRLDAVFVATGTGGSITGIGRRIKETLPDCKVIGIDPFGSVIAQPEELNQTTVQSYLVEGIGKAFVPAVLDRSLVDEWVKTHDKESFLMARELMQKEGLLCGASSGSAVYGAIQWAKQKHLRSDARLVVILADGIRNYLTKHLSKEWMVERGFLDYKELTEYTGFEPREIGSLWLPQAKTLELDTATVQDCLTCLSEQQRGIPLVKDSRVISVVFQDRILKLLSSNQVQKNDKAVRAHSKEFTLVPPTLSLNQITQLLVRNKVVFVLPLDQPLRYITSAVLLEQLQLD